MKTLTLLKIPFILLLIAGPVYSGAQGNKKFADFMQTFDAKLDSLKRNMVQYEAETQRKMKELEIQNMELQQKRQEVEQLNNEIKEKTEFIDSQETFLGVFIGISAVALFSIILLISSVLARKKINKKLEEKNFVIKNQVNQLQVKNQEITDSITYAKRIQQARLPDRTQISASLPESFILFKPKDIVSGDFYFFHRKSSDMLFIAAVDCTGHGVPGAFMSIMGSEKLQDAVLQSSDLSDILKLLNKGIKTSLRQSESDDSTRDGMDIALCCINTTTRTVKFAGANRPFWLVRKGQTMLEETRSTKTAIGGLTENEQNFETHKFDLQAGDTFYICTDGYADQFSENDKKLTSKQFKELLLGIQNKSMKEQENYLAKFLDKWKAKTEQIDDILVIGVRLL